MKKMDELVSMATKNFSSRLEELSRLAEREFKVLAGDASGMEDVVEYLNTLTLNAVQLKTLLDAKTIMDESENDQ